MIVGESVILGTIHSSSLKSRDLLAGPWGKVVAGIVPSPDVTNRGLGDVDGAVEGSGLIIACLLQGHLDDAGLGVELKGVGSGLAKVGVGTIGSACFKLSFSVKRHHKVKTTKAIRLNGVPVIGIGSQLGGEAVILITRLGDFKVECVVVLIDLSKLNTLAGVPAIGRNGADKPQLSVGIEAQQCNEQKAE